MHRIYTSLNFQNEIMKLLPRIDYSVEMLVDEKDLVVISKDLYIFLEKNIQADIIICANTNKKSIRVFNVISRLSELGARVFWLVDKKIDILKSHFLIFDKINVVSRIFYNSENSTEKQVLYFSNIFSNILTKSELMEPQVKAIKAKLFAKTTIIERNDIIKLEWDIENADIFNITPLIKPNEKSGSSSLQLQNDTMFKLRASNKNEQLTKFLFIKVLNNKKINVDVKVFDPIIKKYIYLKPVKEKTIKKYFCYIGQRVVISWDVDDAIVHVIENKSKKMKVKNDLSFIIDKKKNFQIIFELKNTKEIERLVIIPKKDENISNFISFKPGKNNPIKKINNLISNLFLKN